MRFSRKTYSYLFLVLGIFAQSACTNTTAVKSNIASDNIEVKVLEPKVITEYSKNVNAEKEGVDPSNHETARTEWNYGIVPELGFKILKEEKVGKEYKVDLKITSVDLNLGLPIRLLISDKAPPDVVAHENGHIEICKRIYINAKEYGIQCSKKALGKVFSAMNADKKVAISQALRTAGQEIASPYRGLTAGIAKQVSDQYDYICQHSKEKLPVEKLIEMSFSEIQKQNQKTDKK